MIAGRYTQVRELGRGGTGAVWLGHDDVLGRDVALKRLGLLPGADTADLARVEREATLAARLHHPNVVAVYDIVVDPGTDHHWLVMEHVDGPSLGQVVREHGAMSVDQATRIGGQVADALAAAHAAGIAHRDVKPSNVLLDPFGTAKLTDFGIARLTSDPALTQTGLVTGSPAYLAPEVAAGGKGDESVDVWSLGAMLFCLLTGRAPYDGGEPMGTLYRIVHEDPPRLPDAGPLAAVLEHTLVKDPAQRWTMAQVRDRLQQPASYDAPVAAPAPAPTLAATAVAVPPAEPTAAAPLATSGSARSGARRDRRPLLIAGLVAALVLVVLAGWLGLRSGDDPAPAAGGSSPSASPSASPSESPSASPSDDAGPTAAGMEGFIDAYVTAVADDPATSWEMLTPKFQRESGGFERYSSFWGPATNGRVLEISADPDTLVVSYQVRFDNWDNGPGPTVLQLAYEDGGYLIDGETSAGFVPAG